MRISYIECHAKIAQLLLNSHSAHRSCQLLLFTIIFTLDEPRSKLGLIVLMRSMCSMWFDVFDGFDVVRCVR